MKKTVSLAKLQETFKRFRPIWLLLLAGILLLLLTPDGRAEETEASILPEPFCLADLEARLSAALSRIDGAGEVTVVLTVQTGTRHILAEDTEERGEETKMKTVVLSKGGSQQEIVTVQEIYPCCQGALLVCPGGDDAEVRLQLTNAIRALTGLGADKISISKGK